jgi:hypothetical protein
MYAWFNGPGKAFRKPLPGSTNYLSAYDKSGNLLRAKRDDNGRDQSSRQPELEDEEAAARRDEADESLTEGDRERRADERARARASRDAELEDLDERGGIPKERANDMRPYPQNRAFRSQPVLSEELREHLYLMVAVHNHDISSVAASFSVDVRRVAAVVRLKTIEKQWEAEVSQHMLKGFKSPSLP